MTGEQVSIDFTARSQGHASAQLAADHAGQEWQDMAMTFLKAYARLHSEFQCYLVRGFAENAGLPAPPDSRAWGHIVQRASKLGIIRATDRYVSTEHHESHGRPQRVWMSLVCAI